MISIPRDKMLHVVFGGSAAVIVAAIFTFLHFSQPLIFGVIGAALVGAGKEVMDYRSNRASAGHGEKISHTVDPIDFLATVAGGVGAMVLLWLILWAASKV